MTETELKDEIRRIIAFLVVGVVNTIVGYSIYAGLVWIGVGPQPALALAFALGVLWNYATHARFVFGTKGFARMPYYVGVYVAVYVFNALALAWLMRFGLGPLLAQALILPVAVVGTYLGAGAALTGRLPVAVRRPRPPRG